MKNQVKTVLFMTLALATSLAVSGAPRSSARGDAGDKFDAKVKIDQMPKIGPQSLIMAPSLQAQGSQPISKKQRRWGVYEMKYRTEKKWTEDLTINWYVLSDTSKAKEVDRSKTAAKLPPYVYYNATTRYINIPNGDHMSCVCLPPSFIERYGEPVAISCEIVTAEGKVLDAETIVNGVQGISAGKIKEGEDQKRWWNDDNVMNKQTKNGDPLVEPRLGLVDRSKTPFYLVNNADYEQIQ